MRCKFGISNKALTSSANVGRPGNSGHRSPQMYPVNTISWNPWSTKRFRFCTISSTLRDFNFPSSIRNDTKGTVVITTFLNFHESIVLCQIHYHIMAFLQS